MTRNMIVVRRAVFSKKFHSSSPKSNDFQSIVLNEKTPGSNDNLLSESVLLKNRTGKRTAMPSAAAVDKIQILENEYVWNVELNL